MDQDTIEYTDGNYISMQIEELPYDQKDESAYLKFPGDDEDLENTFLPVLIPSPKKNIKKMKQSKKNKRTKKYKKPKGRSKTKVKSRFKDSTQN
jgi:hypothetical protein